MASRARVLAAARSLFEEVGFQGATVRMIAERAGLSPAGVFTTFEDKVAILCHIVGEHRERLYDEIARLAPEFEGTTRDRILRICAMIYADEHPRLKLVAAHLGASHAWGPACEERHRTLQDRIAGVMGQVLREGGERGEIGPHVDLELLNDVVFAIFQRNYRTAYYSKLGLDDMVARLDGQLRLVFEGACPVKERA